MARIIRSSILTIAVAVLLAPAALAERPDDRAGMLGVGATAATQPTITHPDNLPVPRGPGAFPAVAAAEPQSGFDWIDAGLVAIAAIALALAGLAGARAFSRERHRHAAAGPNVRTH